MGTHQGLTLPVLCMSTARTGGPVEDPDVGPCHEPADGFLIAVREDQLVLADVCNDHVSLLAQYLEHLGYVVEEAFLMESKPQIVASLEADAIEWMSLIRD